MQNLTQITQKSFSAVVEQEFATYSGHSGLNVATSITHLDDILYTQIIVSGIRPQLLILIMTLKLSIMELVQN